MMKYKIIQYSLFNMQLRWLPIDYKVWRIGKNGPNLLSFCIILLNVRFKIFSVVYFFGNKLQIERPWIVN